MTMTIMHADPNTDADLDDEDLSDADRGDSLEKVDAAEAADVADPDLAAKPDAAEADEAPEDEDAENVESESEDEDEDEEGGKGKNLALRLNKMREQRDRERAEKDAMAARLAALEAGTAKPTPAEVDPVAAIEAELDALYEKVEEARADGDTKAAAALQRSIDTKNREIARVEAQRVSATTTTQAREDAAYNSLLDAYETEIPALNRDHKSFDPEAVRAMEFYVAAHEKMGMTATKALKAARNVVFGRAAAANDTPAAPAAPVKPKVKPVNVDKVLDTSRRQPADVSDRGLHKDDVSIDPEALSDKEWDALPESKKAQMRGDNG